MKARLILIILAATVILSQSCDRDDDYTQPPLPYFYCKINGQNFAARGGGGCQSRVFYYLPIGYLGIPPKSISLSGTDCVTYDGVAIGLFGYDPNNVLLLLSDSILIDSSAAHFSTYTLGEENILFDSILSGFIKFDQFSDRQGDQNGIVSGTFEFTVKNEELDSTVVVNNGRFQYIIDYEWY